MIPELSDLVGPTLYDPVPFLVAMTFWISNRNGTQLQGTCKVMTWDKSINVNPGSINPERLFNWESTIKKYQMKWLLEEYPPNYHKLWFSLIQGWHYIHHHDETIWNLRNHWKKWGTIGPFLGPKMSTAAAAPAARAPALPARCSKLPWRPQATPPGGDGIEIGYHVMDISNWISIIINMIMDNNWILDNIGYWIYTSLL